MKLIDNLFSPLEQFEIIAVLPIYLCPYFQITLTNFTLFFLFNLGLIWFFFFLTMVYEPLFISTKLQFICELIYLFTLNLIKQQSTIKGVQFFPFFFYIFLLILISNLIGLIPYCYTITSQFFFTFYFAFSINLGLFIYGFIFNGLKFLNFFIPKGVPIILLPLIIIIEIFSYLIRSLSLSVRLFCNMTAGHTLLHIIVSFAIIFINNSFYFSLIFIIFLILAIYLLEFGIAFIQAYVFLILISIYLNDAIFAGH